MGESETGILEAARAIRFYLPELLGQNSTEVDVKLARLLAEAERGENVTDALRVLLAKDATTNNFTKRVLEDPPFFRPPRVQSLGAPRGGEQLVGDPFVQANKYICPEHDYVWYLPEVGTPIPDCPSHPHLLLVHVPAS